MKLSRPIAAASVVAGSFLLFTGTASAHANSIVCIDKATSTFRITNDYPLAESFTSPQGPSGNVAAGNGSYTDVVYVGDSLQIDATWTDGFTETRIGTGDCTPEHETTTTEGTTSTTSTTVIAGTTTTTPATSTTTTTATTQPSTTSSSVETSSTTSTVTSPTTSVPAASTTAPPSSVASSTSSTVPECVDNPNTPTDDCAPVCQPVTQPDGTNSCYRLPATGADVGWLIPAATLMLLAGATTIICGRRR